MKLRLYLFFALLSIASAVLAPDITGQSTQVYVEVPSPQSATTAAPATPATASSANSHIAFDVATVKPAAPLDIQKIAADMQTGKMPRMGAHVDASRAEYIYMSLKDLIVTAYKLKPYQVEGPSWIGDQRFDIEATMPDGATKDDAPAMLQALLADRFKLTVHRDKTEHKVLALIVGKGGPNLKESPAAPADIDPNAPLQPGETKMDTENGPIIMSHKPDGTIVINMGKKGTITEKVDVSTQSIHMESTTVTMDGFADMLTTLMQMGGSGAPQVVDTTGLKGNYQVAVDLSLAGIIAMARAQFGNISGAPGGGGAQTNDPANAASDPESGQTVYTSVEKLGLRLDERKATVERLVVDHAEKIPSED